MIQSLINEPVKTLNLFNCIPLEEPNVKIIENSKEAFTLYEYSQVNYFTLLTKEEYIDLYLLDFSLVGLLKPSSVEKKYVINATIIEHDRHPDDDIISLSSSFAKICQIDLHIFSNTQNQF